MHFLRRFALITGFSLVFPLVYWLQGSVFSNTKIKCCGTTGTKNILLWNGYDRIETGIFLQESMLNHMCPFKNCKVTSDRQLVESLSQFDAIIFNMAVLHQLTSDKLPPSNLRRIHQRYIFFTQESPYYHVESVKDYVGYFNWTMSYLPDSDIWFPYGRVDSRQQKAAIKRQTGNNKTKLLAWFVSHCSTQSRREKYVKELLKYIPVDIYGLCGSLKCGWNELAGISEPKCYDMLEKDYKFYLSFENSLCKNYVTEKFFSILKRNVVPVVMGVANYSAIAPPHSFIDALLYTPKELADFLLMLDSNDTLYNSYLEWKTNKYTIRSGYQEMGQEALCSLCIKLNQDTENKVAVDLLSSWKPAIRCLNSHYMKAFRGIDRIL